MKEWSDFYVATAGASAALSGLIFVGVSISLNRILSFPTLPERAIIALILLVNILIVSVLMLVPGQSLFVQGLELSLLATGVWFAASRIDRNIYRNVDKQFMKQHKFSIAFNQFSLIPYMVAGVLMLLGHENGVYWLAPAILSSFIKGVSDGWVMLVEINR